MAIFSASDVRVDLNDHPPKAVAFAAFDDLDWRLTLECRVGSAHPFGKLIGEHDLGQGLTESLGFDHLLASRIAERLAGFPSRYGTDRIPGHTGQLSLRKAQFAPQVHDLDLRNLVRNRFANVHGCLVRPDFAL